METKYTKEDWEALNPEQKAVLQMEEDVAIEANSLREKMAKGAVDDVIKQLTAISDQDLVSAVARHIKIKIKLF